MYRAPRCPNCRRDYAGPHVQGGAHQPLILKCGHTFCQACLAKIYKYLKHELACPQCKVSTPLPAGEVSFKELPPDFYALGIAAWTYTNKTPDFFAHKVEFQTRQDRDEFKGKALKGGRALCDECSQETASCRCEQCDEDLCEKCWSKLHKNNSKSKNPHHRIQIQIGVYGCEEHDNMPREFYCKDDDKPICAYCGLTGDHKGHTIIPIAQQNVEVQDLLKPAFDTAKDVLKKLYYSNVDVDKAMNKVKRESSPAANAIRMRFSHLHAMLQRRETMLLQELNANESDRLDHLGQMERSLKNNISRLETVMSDVAQSLKGTSNATPNMTEMISILNSASELPCYVIQDGVQDEPIAFQSDDEIIQHVMTHGSVDSSGRLSWDLKTQDDLPDNYVQPKIADTILSNSKLFSVTAAGKSELKSPSGKGRGDQKKTPNPKNHVSSQNGTASQAQQQTAPAKKRGQQQQQQPAAPRKASSQAASKIIASCSSVSQNLVHVVHIRSPARFYIQRKADRPRLDRMMKALYKLCESEDKKKRMPDPLVVGLRCCCKFSADSQWYRAIIKTLPDSLQNGGQATLDPDDKGDEEKEPKVEVGYIDYGNTEWVPISRLCKIRPKYEREPDIAICCSLVDIVSTQKDGRWPREASEAFQAMVEGQEAVLMSQRGQVGNVLYVDLHQQPNDDIKDDMPISLRDALVFLELACFISPESVPKPQAIVPPKRYLPPTVPCKGDDFVVQVSHITDPQCFSVQDMEIVDYLNEMMEKIQVDYAKRIGPEWQVFCPHPGLVCMAFFQEDQRWYRGEVLRAAGKQQVEVLYVDYGNTATIHYTQLKKMTDDFLKLYRLSLPCGLVDVAPKDKEIGWTDESKLVFSQCVSFKPLDVSVMDVKEGVIRVIAYDEVEGQRVSVNALLVQRGLAETTGPGSVSAEILRGLSPKPTPILPDTTTTPSEDNTHHVDSSGDKITRESVSATTDGTPLKSPEPMLQVPSTEAAQETKPARTTPTAARSSRGSSVTIGCSRSPGQSSQLSGKYSAYTAVHVSHAEAPSCIYVQLSTAGKDGLDSLLESMTLFYKEEGDCEKTDWKEGEICGALLVREGVWCRGKIQCMLPDNNAVVLFTDYGNEEVVSIANIRALDERFQKEAPFAIRCHLVDILPAGGTAEWTKTSCDFLEERLNDLECYICKKGDIEKNSLPIDLLYELTNKERVARESAEDLASIAELLVQKGLALRKRRKVSTPEVHKNIATPHVTAQTPPSSHPTTTTTTLSPKMNSAPVTPQSSGVSSLNTTASPTSLDGPTMPDEGCPAMPADSALLLDEYENFEGTGIQEILPQYPAPPLPTLSQLQLIITFVSDNAVIHGLDVDRFEDFQQMMAAQQVACNSQKRSPPDPSSLSLCQCVCARFTLDEQWYRAKIIGITEDTVRVKYVDFGNSESLPFDRINPTPFQLNVPQYSRECVLYGIQPKSPSKIWSASAISFLLETLVEKTCVAHIRAICLKDEPLTVELTLPTGESVVRLMLSNGLVEFLADCDDLDEGGLDDASTITDGTSTPAFSRAISEDGEDVTHYNSEIPRSVVNVLQGVAETEEVMAIPGHTFNPIMLPDVGVYFWVTVSHLDEPDLLYIQYTQTSMDDPDPTIALAAQQAFSSEALVAQLASMAPNLPFLLNPQPDMPCCAQYSVDERWYRAEITEVVRKDIIMCHVRFIDYGTVEWLSLNSIRQLPVHFLELPLQCRLCRLTGIQAPADLPPNTPLQAGTQWPAAAIKRVVEMVSNKVLVAAVEEDGPIPMISLYQDTTQTLPIYYPLVEEGLADTPANSEEQLVTAAFKEVGRILSAGRGQGQRRPRLKGSDRRRSAASVRFCPRNPRWFPQGWKNDGAFTSSSPPPTCRYKLNFLEERENPFFA
ncbi:RING finger protein 17 isoform X2 [Strongylocentrotus purpuratus]|uniref:Ring finger protein 17 n=1 Tax=Strongylocentrotus purpuratus TaxID=7668 RepID=A0A7M7PI16_STRPU|nr:RING finger protein 17 isoform X2 [Strongylocentrotus purpuratus]